MSRRRRETGKSPAQDRSLDLLRAGKSALDVSIATGVGTATIKRWARAAGVAVPAVTFEERERRQAERDRTRSARVAYSMAATAEKVARR